MNKMLETLGQIRLAELALAEAVVMISDGRYATAQNCLTQAESELEYAKRDLLELLSRTPRVTAR